MSTYTIKSQWTFKFNSSHNDRNSFSTSSKWDALLSTTHSLSGIIWRVAWLLRVATFSKGWASVLHIFSSSVFIEVDSWAISWSVMLLLLIGISITTIRGCAGSSHVSLLVGDSVLAIWRGEIILSWWWVMRGTLGWEPSWVLILQISRALNILNHNRAHIFWGSIVRFIGWSVSTSYNSGLDFVLRASNNIIDPCSNILNLIFPIKSLSNLVISLDESLELFLKAVVLVVEVGHMLVQCVDLSLQVDLISHHLLWMWLEAVNLILDRLLILFTFLELNNQLLLSEGILFTLNILVFITLEQLGLSVFMLLILALKVSKLTV